MLNVSIVHRLLVAATTALVPLLMLSSTEDARAQTAKTGQFRVLLANGEFSANIQSVREIDLSKAVANYCPGRTCNVDVKVTVPDEGKVCSWEFPLIIYVKMPEVVIKWRLTNSSSAGAEFVDIGGKPGPGIDIKPDASGSKHYKNPKRMPKEFSWDRASAGLSVSAYDFNVQFDGGRQNCEIPDPLIINID